MVERVMESFPYLFIKRSDPDRIDVTYIATFLPLLNLELHSDPLPILQILIRSTRIRLPFTLHPFQDKIRKRKRRPRSQRVVPMHRRRAACKRPLRFISRLG